MKKYINNKKINFDNIFFSFPVFAGILYIFSNFAILCQVKKQGNIHLKTFSDRQIIKNNIPFLRGIENIVNSFIIFVKYLILSVKNYFVTENTPNEKNKIKNKKTIFKNILLFSIIILSVVLFSFFLFWFLPAIIGFAIFPNQYNIFLKNLSVGIVKCLILWLAIFSLRFFTSIKNFLQIITAGNIASCFGKKFNALNFFNVLVVTLLIDFFVVSLIGLQVSWLWEFVFQVAIFFVCCGFAFEICLMEENSTTFLSKLKIITCILFYATPSKTDKQLAFCGFTEGERMKENEDKKKFVDITTNQNCYPMALVLSEVKIELKKSNIEDYGEAEWLVACVLGCKKLDLRLIDTINAEQYEAIQDVLKRRMNNEPLAKIFGETEFYGLKILVNKNVLTPRQETEILVEEIIKDNKDKKGEIEILDLCAGSGAIGIALAHNLKNAQVLALDISEEALIVAQKNADINNTKNIKFKQSDLFTNVKKRQKFDVIVSNPPYIATDEISKLNKEVKNFDPIIALDGGVDGMYFYKKIAETAPIFLKENGKLFLEIGFNQGSKLKKLLTPHFENIKIFKDYAGLPRIVVATKK